MKVYMDDLRPTPVGWERTYTVEETIDKLKTKSVSDLSLDNDLGEGLLEGFKVLDWLEREVFFNPSFPIPVITIHSANEGRAPMMRMVARKLEFIRQKQLGDSDAS